MKQQRFSKANFKTQMIFYSIKVLSIACTLKPPTCASAGERRSEAPHSAQSGGTAGDRERQYWSSVLHLFSSCKYVNIIASCNHCYYCYTVTIKYREIKEILLSIRKVNLIVYNSITLIDNSGMAQQRISCSKSTAARLGKYLNITED